MKFIRPGLVLFGLLTITTGAAYPLLVTGMGRLFFAKQVQGSLLTQKNTPTQMEKSTKGEGAILIGQEFQSPRYFWGRPSKTNDFPYNAKASSGSNQGPTNLDFIHEVKERIRILKEADPDNKSPIPVDLVTASGSGLDPHISQAAADYQVKRVARARNRPEAEVIKLVKMYTEERQFFILGEPRVNVLLLNLALDK